MSEPIRSEKPIMSEPIRIEKLVVKSDRIVCEVCISPESYRYTSEALMQKVCQAYPYLPHHTCVNGRGDCFSTVMNHTSVAHLLEHLVIELHIQANETSDTVFVGTTEWLDKEKGQARIAVNFTDDLVALQAFRDATYFLNEVMLK